MTLPFNAPDTQAPAVTLAPGWRLALSILAALMLLSVGLYLDAYTDMVQIWWRSGTFNHCFLILPISAYLIHERRAELARLTPTPALLGMLAVLGTSLLGGLGQAADVMAVQHFAAVALWPLLAWAVLGHRIAWTLIFPFSYLLFAVPVGEFMVPTLQDITAHFAVTLVDWSGIPVLLEGRFITIPKGNFVVAEACSGMNTLMAFMAFGTLYAYMQYRQAWRRIAFVVMCFVVAIVANGVRAYGIIMIAHLSDMTLAVGVDHIIYGFVFLAFIMAIMIIIGNYFREDLSRPAGAAAQSETQAADTPRHWLGLPTALSVAAGALLAGWIAAGSAMAPPTVQLPAAEGQWNGPNLTDEPLAATYPGAQLQSAVYESAEGAVILSAAYYAKESQGRELVSFQNRDYDENLWQRLDEREYRLPGSQKVVRRLHLKSATGDYLLYRWYDIGGQQTTSDIKAKLFSVYAKLTRQTSGQAVLRAIAPINGDPAEAERLLDNYLLALDTPLSALTTAP